VDITTPPEKTRLQFAPAEPLTTTVPVSPPPEIVRDVAVSVNVIPDPWTKDFPVPNAALWIFPPLASQVPLVAVQVHNGIIPPTGNPVVPNVAVHPEPTTSV